jgi:hypothetical protein
VAYDSAKEIGFGLEERSIRCLTCEQMASPSGKKKKAAKAGSPKTKAAKAGSTKPKAAKAPKVVKAAKAANVKIPNKVATPEAEAEKTVQAKASQKSK